MTLAVGLLAGCAASLDNPETASLATKPGQSTSAVASAMGGPVGTSANKTVEPVGAGISTASIGGETASSAHPEKSAVVAQAAAKKSTGKEATKSNSATDATAAQPTTGSPNYKIGALDVLEISVFKVPELARVVQVAENGAINLPLVGETKVAGLTAQEIERDLARKLGEKYLQKPQVAVTIKEFNSQQITIEGAVAKPGVYPLKGKMSILQVIAMSGGVTEVAESEVVLVREVNGKRTAERYNLDEIRTGAVKNAALVTGDVLIIGASAIKTAFNNLLKALPIATMVAKPL